jgi:hypothetical protein
VLRQLQPRRHRSADLQSPTYAAGIATELVPWLRSSYATSRDPKDVVIGRLQRWGAAGDIALKYAAVFGNALLQSGGAARLLPTYIDAPKVPVRFYLEVRLYEEAYSTMFAAQPSRSLHLAALIVTDFNDVARIMLFSAVGGPHGRWSRAATSSRSTPGLLLGGGKSAANAVTGSSSSGED